MSSIGFLQTFDVKAAWEMKSAEPLIWKFCFSWADALPLISTAGSKQLQCEGY